MRVRKNAACVCVCSWPPVSRGFATTGYQPSGQCSLQVVRVLAQIPHIPPQGMKFVGPGNSFADSRLNYVRTLLRQYGSTVTCNDIRVDSRTMLRTSSV